MVVKEREWNWTYAAWSDLWNCYMDLIHAAFSEYTRFTYFVRTLSHIFLWFIFQVGWCLHLHRIIDFPKNLLNKIDIGVIITVQSAMVTQQTYMKQRLISVPRDHRDPLNCMTKTGATDIFHPHFRWKTNQQKKVRIVVVRKVIYIVQMNGTVRLSSSSF